MLPFTRFIRDIRGGMVEKLAVMAGAVALASMGGAHFLNIATRDANSPLVAALHRGPAPTGAPASTVAPGVDYTPTASIRKQVGQVVLDPCTGKPR